MILYEETKCSPPPSPQRTSECNNLLCFNTYRYFRMLLFIGILFKKKKRERERNRKATCSI